jgi:hypothetical protein
MTKKGEAGRGAKAVPNGNGAGIAADPTLTGVWVLKNALRLTFRCSPEGRRLCRPALAPVPVPSGAGCGPKTFPLPPGGSETDFVARLSHGSNDAGHRRSIEADRQIRPADCAPSRFQRSGSCSIRRCPGFHPSTVRHFAVASREVPKSLLFSGCYPVHPKSQSPLSMSGECAARPSRARANRPTYPLSAILPVDKSG